MFISRFSTYQCLYNYGRRCFSNVNNRPVFDLSLYLVTHRSYNEDIFIAKIISAVKGGATCIQIRDRAEDLDALMRTVKKLKSLLTPFSIPILINDYVEIAQAIGADGVHLGQKDLPYHIARKILGPNAIIGLSVDNWDDVLAAQDLDVDYLGVSQLFGSKTTKTDYQSSWELEGLKRIRAFSRHRLAPIGGINASNLASVCEILQLGAEKDGIAMVGELWRAKEPEKVAQKMRSIMHVIKNEA